MTGNTEVIVPGDLSTRSSESVPTDFQVPITSFTSLFNLLVFLNRWAFRYTPKIEKFCEIRYRYGVVFFFCGQMPDLHVNSDCQRRLISKLHDGFYMVLYDNIHKVSIGNDGRCYLCTEEKISFAELATHNLVLDDTNVVLLETLLPREFSSIYLASIQNILHDCDGEDLDED